MNNKPEHGKGSVLNRQATEQRIVYRMKHITYWKQFESKKGFHKTVNAILFKMQKVSGEFLIEPRLLQKFFLLYLNKFHPSQQNLQRALNVTRVYSLLVHQFYKSAKKFKIHTSFYVSPSVWQKWFIGRKAKENSLLILKEIGLIIYYRFNRRKHTIAQNSRFEITSSNQALFGTPRNRLSISIVERREATSSVDNSLLKIENVGSE